MLAIHFTSCQLNSYEWLQPVHFLLLGNLTVPSNYACNSNKGIIITRLITWASYCWLINLNLYQNSMWIFLVEPRSVTSLYLPYMLCCFIFLVFFLLPLSVTVYLMLPNHLPFTDTVIPPASVASSSVCQAALYCWFVSLIKLLIFVSGPLQSFKLITTKEIGRGKWSPAFSSWNLAPSSVSSFLSQIDLYFSVQLEHFSLSGFLHNPSQNTAKM